MTAGTTCLATTPIRKALLICGVAASVLYALMIWGIRYEGYSPISQAPSELTAIGAPTRALCLLLAHASLGLLWPFAAMHQREVLAAGGGTLSELCTSSWRR